METIVFFGITQGLFFTSGCCLRCQGLGLSLVGSRVWGSGGLGVWDVELRVPVLGYLGS